MITKQQIETMFQNDVDSTREWRKQYKADYAQIEIVFNETREIGPRKTVETLIDRLGYDRAKAVVATMINSIGEWDGRISDRNRAWAKTIDEAFDKEAARDAFIYCSIHSCHADQIASEMRRAERPVETVETIEEESAEEAVEEAVEEATETDGATVSDPEEDAEKRIEMLAWSIQDAIERENTGAMTDEEIEQIEAEESTTEGQEAMIDGDKIVDYINYSCKDPSSLGAYDYKDAMRIDIAQYILDNMTSETIDGIDEDDLSEQLNEDLWIADDVTGNGSGSYTFSRSQAAENVRGNEDLVREMIREFDLDVGDVVDRFLDSDYEWFDVSIRCYLLGEMISTVIRDLVTLGAIRFAA